MKKIVFVLIFSILLLGGYSSRAQEINTDEAKGALTYCLPKTAIMIEVTAEKHTFFAGPYAGYAKKYLGIEVPQKDETCIDVKDITMYPLLEADQSYRFAIMPGKETISFLQMTSQGLISTGAGMVPYRQWRFPSIVKSDFSDKGVGANLTSESATLYRNVKNEDAYNTIAVQQKMIVEKSLENKALEAAEMIFSLRKKRVQIITGDTDATYSGEAMGAALKEISNLEKEYMSLFIGYTTTQMQKMTYEVVPNADNKKQIYIAFRVAQNKGLVPADNVSGKPYMLTIDYDKVNPAVSRTGRSNVAYYRIPATGNVKLGDGVNILCRIRMPIYQLGIVSTFPLKD